jgi:hypothetical protein
MLRASCPMTRLQRHRQVTNWRESCRISPRRQHAVTDHPPRHALSLPAAGRLWRAPNDASSTRLPRSKSDRGEPRDQSRAEEPMLRSGRIRQSCGDRAVFGRAKELCFESTVRLEHSPLDPADLDLEDAARTFPVDHCAYEMPDLAYCIERHQPGPTRAG